MLNHHNWHQVGVREDIRYEREKMAPDLMQLTVVLGMLGCEKITQRAGRSVMFEGVIA